ncbi:MAG: hypothetical protein RLZZ546_419, partial [Bacteroidota bacterium]
MNKLFINLQITSQCYASLLFSLYLSIKILDLYINKNSNMRFFLFNFICLFAFSIAGQNPHLATEGMQRKQSTLWRSKAEESSFTSSMPLKNIGPTIMSGRITDIDVNPQNTIEFYIAYASGGLWYTQNTGMSFEPCFDHEDVMTIGAIAVHWPSHTVYVGTGEVNSSRSSYAGIGIFKSTDKGKTWQHLGLNETHHIGEIIVDTNNANKITVAAMGHLYSSNTERGIFQSEDGGKSWGHTLKINEKTGCVDLITDPKNPNILYTSSWQRDRKAWNFEGSGVGSDVYKSADGGTT